MSRDAEGQPLITTTDDTSKCFLAPEPKAQDKLLWLPLLRLFVCLFVCPSVRPHLWTTSPLKPLGQISSFMWSLVLKGDWKYEQMVVVRNQDSRHVYIPRYMYSSHRLIMGKTEKILLLRNHEAHSFYILYVAMFSGPLHKSCQSSPWGLNWPRPRGRELP